MHTLGSNSSIFGREYVSASGHHFSPYKITQKSSHKTTQSDSPIQCTPNTNSPTYVYLKKNDEEKEEKKRIYAYIYKNQKKNR